MKQTKKHIGRPSRYRAEYADQAFPLCLLGATDADLAGFFAVSEQTVNSWKARHPAFLESLKNGKDEADAKVAQSLYRRALGYSHDAVRIFNHDGRPLIVPYTEHYPPDTVAAIFWLKNRQRSKWRDKQEHEVTGANGGPIEHALQAPASTTLDEWANVAARQQAQPHVTHSNSNGKPHGNGHANGNGRG